MFCTAVANAMGMKILQKQEVSGEFAMEQCTFVLLYLLVPVTRLLLGGLCGLSHCLWEYPPQYAELLSLMQRTV